MTLQHTCRCSSRSTLSGGLVAHTKPVLETRTHPEIFGAEFSCGVEWGVRRQNGERSHSHVHPFTTSLCKLLKLLTPPSRRHITQSSFLCILKSLDFCVVMSEKHTHNSSRIVSADSHSGQTVKDLVHFSCYLICHAQPEKSGIRRSKPF